MSKSTSMKFIIFLLAAACASAALVFVDAGAFAQNANSSTTMQHHNENANAGRRGTRRGSRRGTRRNATENANANTGDATGTETPATDTSGQMDAGTSAARNTSGSTQADLSGTYTGRLTLTGGHEMKGEATLTITGNSFTLSSEGMSHSGTVTAVTTRGYTGASFFFSDVTDSVSNTPLVASVRARKTGTRLTLSPVPGARNKMTFAGRSQ